MDPVCKSFPRHHFHGATANTSEPWGPPRRWSVENYPGHVPRDGMVDYVVPDFLRSSGTCWSVYLCGVLVRITLLSQWDSEYGYHFTVHNTVTRGTRESWELPWDNVSPGSCRKRKCRRRRRKRWWWWWWQHSYSPLLYTHTSRAQVYNTWTPTFSTVPL